MTIHSVITVDIYTNFFLKDRTSPYSTRKAKAKEKTIKYASEKLKQSNNKEDIMKWSIINKYAKRL